MKQERANPALYFGRMTLPALAGWPCHFGRMVLLKPFRGQSVLAIGLIARQFTTFRPTRPFTLAG